MNLCRSCGQDFGSLSAFDKHRVGKHAHTFAEGLAMEPPREDGRRCLNVEELTAVRWNRDTRGRWRGPADTSRLFRAVHARSASETTRAG